MTIAIIGARHGSLGEAIAEALRSGGRRVITAGISTEDNHLDASDYTSCLTFLTDHDIDQVVCTVGLNQGGPVYGDDWVWLADDMMQANYLTPMKLLHAYLTHIDGSTDAASFVAISSNSAHIARSESAAYCASKAALSMALRCAARDTTRAGRPVNIWGYELGALSGTEMTREVARRLPKGVQMSRMLSTPAGMNTRSIGTKIAGDVMYFADQLHGTMQRIDNGEQ